MMMNETINKLHKQPKVTYTMHIDSHRRNWLVIKHLLLNSLSYFPRPLRSIKSRTQSCYRDIFLFN